MRSNGLRSFQTQKVPPCRERLKPPAHGRAIHPFVHWLWLEMNHQQISQEDVAFRSGVSSSAMRKWRTGQQAPTLAAIQAVVQVLGHDIVIRRATRHDEEE